MVKLLQKLFGKAPTPAPAPVVRAAPVLPMAKVEIASLSLTSIIERFPEELRKTVLAMPADDAMVALPLLTILKQLPGGSVKMSLASVHRQAPPGTFQPGRTEEKRMVEVPLAEIFKRVKPDLLKRRPDQRQHDLAEEGIDVFGDKENPYAVAPHVAEDETVEERPVMTLDVDGAHSPGTTPEPSPTSMRMEPMIAAPPLGSAPSRSAQALDAAEPMRVIAPPLGFAAAPLEFGPKLERNVAPPPATSLPDPTEPPAPSQPPLVLLLKDVSAAWPPEIVDAIGSTEDATISLPASEITAGLARGKVAFPWSRLREWITPPLSGEANAADSVELQLPLRVVAPAFLKASSRDGARKVAAVDESIPSLFEAAPASTASPAPAPQSEGTDAPAPVGDHAPAPLPVVEEPMALAPSPATPEAPLPLVMESMPPIAEAGILPPLPASTAPITIGEVFGVADKAHWPPAEIVQHTVMLPQVAGAIVALQEGLVVAHQLPEGMKGEVVAAFLPQIFGRLNQYSSEMQLGEVDELLFSTRGAYFQIFRIGYVFFAVLGKPGEALPWDDLRIIADEVAKQTNE